MDLKLLLSSVALFKKSTIFFCFRIGIRTLICFLIMSKIFCEGPPLEKNAFFLHTRMTKRMRKTRFQNRREPDHQLLPRTSCPQLSLLLPRLLPLPKRKCCWRGMIWFELLCLHCQKGKTLVVQ